MTLRDLVEHAAGNLWRMKLRAFLTISGIVIAIAAFVAMLSFGAGMEENIATEFNELGLFSTMQVYPKAKRSEADQDTTRALDNAAVQSLTEIPGVSLAYPYEEFSVQVQLRDTAVATHAQALSAAAIQTKLYSRLEAGRGFSSDGAKEAVVTDRFLDDLAGADPDSLLGQQLVVSVSVASLDSGLARLVQHRGAYLRERLKAVNYDSLANSEYRGRVLRDELSGAMSRFIDGYLNARSTVADTLTICGVVKATRGRSRMAAVIVPVATAGRFNAAGFSGGLPELFSALGSGSLFAEAGSGTAKAYDRVTVLLEPGASYEAVTDSITALGFNSFSYAAEFRSISKAFLYFELALGMIGIIALVTASLGIVNTMVMSIIERRREIGVLKSLGADEGEVRLLFLVESGVMGSVGAAGGILLGWAISRVASFVAKTVMARQGVDVMELFSLPAWLILIAFALGLVVSLMAGYYPASRAARVDPVEALRNE